MFVVGKTNGFLPRKHPVTSLPAKYSIIEKLLSDMVMEQKDGSKGLLWDGRFAERVQRDLPLIDLSDVKDQELRAALFRDYTFLLSAYILEPCDISFRKTKNYGIGRDHLPKSIAVPVC